MSSGGSTNSGGFERSSSRSPSVVDGTASGRVPASRHSKRESSLQRPLPAPLGRHSESVVVFVTVGRLEFGPQPPPERFCRSAFCRGVARVMRSECLVYGMRTHVTFVLDSSGSMSSIKDDTIGGFNEFLADQQEGEGEVTVSLYDFDTGVETVYHGKSIANADKLDDETYTPGGRTALHDALSTAITETDRRIEKTPGGIRPENVIVVTLTDGKENASETPHDRVQELVEEHREEHDWEFLFIGANQDAALAATDMGMDADRSLDMSHSGEGSRAAYQSTSERLHRAREEGTTGGYEEEDRQRQRDAEGS
jgi:uncharacterized protein YegL